MKISEFIDFGGEFDKRYKGKESAGNERFFTYKAAISLFLQNPRSKNILETGCQRQVDDWGAGCSSTIFAETLATFPDKGKLCSIDIDPNNLIVCHNCIKKFGDYYKLIHADSVRALEIVNFPIGLLYLDSMDYHLDIQVASQEHQLKEIKAIYDKLNGDTIILLDDNHFENGGKSKLTKEFLREKKWTCVLDNHQSLWIKI